MESQYYEHLVHCKVSPLVQAARIISVVGFVFCLFLLPVSLIVGLIGCVLMGLAFWFSNREARKDYEYVYIDGDISFDAIYNNSRRKTRSETRWEETKLVCRAGALELEGYRRKNAKIRNFTSYEKDSRNVYAVVTENQGNPVITYFEPAEEMLEMMWKKSPSIIKR